MVYEMRTYHVCPGRMPEMIDRFRSGALPLFEKHGICQAGFWTMLVGGSNLDLMYLLKWNSMAEREERWTAFSTDPEWIAIRTASERNGPLVASVTNAFLAPTEFSRPA